MASDIHIHLPLSAGAHPNQEAPPARSGLAGIRRTAARNVYQLDPSDGQKQPNKDAPPAKANVATKTAPAPVKSKTAGKNKQALEGTPPFAKEQVTGDGFGRANEQARAMHRKAAKA